MSNILGVSAGFHDAALSVINHNGDILFASHSERFSRKKHDPNLCDFIIKEALSYGDIDTVAYYEKPWLKKLRAMRAGQSTKGMRWRTRSTLHDLLQRPDVLNSSTRSLSFSHHLSHAAAGFQTSPFNDATIVVIDAIGEFDTISIWNAYYDKNGFARYKLEWRQGYPHSIGMFYSAMTKHVGLRPMDEEYILMGMAAYGVRQHAERIVEHIVERYMDADVTGVPKFKENLHIGFPEEDFYGYSKFDIAMAAQDLVEFMITRVLDQTLTVRKSTNLVYAGGVALNCSANRNLNHDFYFDNIWIMPNPGDAGSSLGAAALAYGKKLNWKDAFLGYNIEGEYPVKPIIDELITNQIVGVANGRAEFGPRALGNRSLLADPRGKDIKDKVNEIKRRQNFRPFAPVILEEHAADYFQMPPGFETSPYMQTTAVCKHPDEYPAIIHADKTSRVQTVPDDGSGIRKLLEAWKVYTGCPMLLNTSLNIRGEPMVNSVADALRFQMKYGIKVHCYV